MKKLWSTLLSAIILFSCSKEDLGIGKKSNEKEIKTFAFIGINPAIACIINEADKTISATVPAGTGITNLTPTIALSPNATSTPASGASQDFSKPVMYKVKAEDGSIQDYTVKITQAKKYINVIKVVNSWVGYNDNSWERQHSVYETNDMQIFMVIIWNTSTPKVSLYKFNANFDPTQSAYIYGGAAWVNYRESFNILNVNLTATTSAAYTDAFKQVFEKITTDLPAQHYGVKYSGHGVATGGLFENKISATDTRNLLSYFNGLINAKIDFLDWNTNCNGGTYKIIANQYQYANYILASDLPRGGYNFDVNEYFTYNHELNIHKFFTPAKTIRNSLVEMMNSERSFWVSSVTKNYMVSGLVTQSISIFDTQKFIPLVNSTNMATANYVGDALQYIRQVFPAQEQAFNEFRFHYISNKDFFNWPVNSNGFYLN